MNNSLTAEFINGLVLELRSYLVLCEDILSLTVRENQALASPTEYQPSEFHQKRKTLLPDIESLLTKLKHRRLAWQQVPAAERERCEEVKPLFQNIQNLLMKVLLLDRENQQAMLRRGLIPAAHLPAPAVQKPHYVANLYRQNSPTQLGLL
jgi:hypothetical protein